MIKEESNVLFVMVIEYMTNNPLHYRCVFYTVSLT